MNKPIYWYENPKNEEGLWKERIAANAYHGESPLMVDLVGNGVKLPLAGINVEDTLYHLGQISPTENIDDVWKFHTIGSTKIKAFKGPEWDRRSRWFAAGARDHGLGAGDINGNDRIDVLTTRGWYESPQNPSKENWKLHYTAFDSLANPEYPQYQFAQMPIFDIDQDGDNDFFGSSAHRYGLWWFEQTRKNDKIEFVKHNLPIKMSQVHAVAMADINENGIPDLVTGKRWLAHNGNDPGWDETVKLLWLKPQIDQLGKIDFNYYEIDKNSGVGTQIEITDINGDGKEDILTSSKKGTFLFLQE